MKKYIVLTFIMILCAFFLCGCKQNSKNLDDLDVIKERGYVIAGVKNDSPPFGYYDDKVLRGIDIEIAKDIANYIFGIPSEANVKLVPVTAQNRIAKLNSKEVDMLVATMSINEKRKLVMDFSTPYFVTAQKIMVRKDSSYKGLQDFNTEGRLSIVLGTTGEKISRLIAPNARITPAKSYIEAYDYLENKEVDGILGDDAILSGFKGEDYRIINRAYSKEYYAVAVRKSKKSKELLIVINSAIAGILDDKKLKVLKKRYIDN